MSLVALPLILNRIDALIKKLDQLISLMVGVPPADMVVPPTVVITEPKRNNRYHIFALDTATARTDEELGVKDLMEKVGIEYATYMVILSIGGGFTYKQNSKVAPSVTGAVGASWEAFEIEEVYITNVSAAGTAQIHIEYRVEPD